MPRNSSSGAGMSDHAQRHAAVAHQADIDDEFVLAAGELARAVERIDQPEAAAPER